MSRMAAIVHTSLAGSTINMATQKEEYLYWSPYQTFVWTREQVNQWADQTGGVALYNGVVWDMNYKQISPDRYNVSFTQRKY